MVQRSRRSERRQNVSFVPTVMTNTIMGAAAGKSVTQRGKEIIGYIDINQYTPSGILAEIMCNPLLLGAPRLEKMAAIYQQYRMKRMAFTLATVLPTTTYGQFWIAYSRNPDHAIANDANANANVFALENSRQCQAWTPVTYECDLRPNTTIFNIDPDSREIMKTTQGKFFISTSGHFNVTGDFEVPVYLEYEIELYGQSALNIYDDTAIVMPATRYSGPSDPNGSVQLIIAPGETLDYPWNRGMTSLRPYYCIPAPVIQTGTANVNPEIIVWDGNTSGYFRFYLTLDDYDNGVHLVITNSVIDQYVDRYSIQAARAAAPAPSAFRALSTRFRPFVPIPQKAVPPLRMGSAKTKTADAEDAAMAKRVSEFFPDSLIDEFAKILRIQMRRQEAEDRGFDLV